MPLHLLLSLLLLCAPLVHADEGIVTLQHRPATELVPLLAPFLGDEERVVANGDQLILSATPERLHRLGSIARSLDRPLVGFTLSLRRNPPPAPGTRSYRVGGAKEQRIAITEGETVELFEGERELVVRRGFEGFHGRGLELDERERGDRLRVRVWLVGDQAVVELETRDEGTDREGGGIRELRTRLQTAPGEWRQLTGPLPEPRTLATTKERGLWIKLELGAP